MKLVKDEKLAKLFDLYRGVLSDTQQDFLYDFVYRDLTISEIAENNMISRQAAKDAINKGINKMNSIEGKVNFLKIIESLEGRIEELEGKVKV